MRYTIELNDASVEVDVRRVAGGRFSVQIGAGERRTVDAHVGAGLVHVLDGHASTVVLSGARGQGAHVRARGLDRVLQVLDPRTARLRARQRGGLGAGGDAVIASPMPGRMVKLLVKVGDAVEPGQGVAIVEAMKMENELRAEAAGVVEAVLVAPGDRVEGGTELVRLELAGE